MADAAFNAGILSKTRRTALRTLPPSKREEEGGDALGAARGAALASKEAEKLARPLTLSYIPPPPTQSSWARTARM